ncbi:MAG: alkaline phosphatase family protein, partial [Planctomycetota bacterium]
MRTCVIDMPGLSNQLLDSLPESSTPEWLTALQDTGRATIRPVLPAVTMTAQATFTTGVNPDEHGIIANGLPAYRLPEIHDHLDLSNYEDYRANVSFWEQSDKLLTAPRVWRENGRKTAMLFVQSSMGGACDVVVTPKPKHTPDGQTISTCWASPEGLNERLVEELGMFPLHHYWGPMAGLPSSQWIVECARRVWDWHPCELQWVYIPHMD